MKKQVVLLHRNGFRDAGSKIMRCDQLCEIGQRYLGADYVFSVRNQKPIRDTDALRRTCERLTGCIVILLKSTAAMFGDEGMEQIRKAARAVLIDYVDGDVHKSYSTFADIHIGASHAGCRLLEGMLMENGERDVGSKVMYLTHHADPRLAGLKSKPANRPLAVYMGHPKNVFVPDAIREKVNVLRYETDGNIHQVFDDLQNFNLHYCVRPPRRDVGQPRSAKPFTKGFTAAMMGANVITARDTDDAEYYLGADYPFLVDDLSNEGLAAMFEKVDDVFGTPLWHEAEERMDDVRHRSSAAAVAEDLKAILSLFD